MALPHLSYRHQIRSRNRGYISYRAFLAVTLPEETRCNARILEAQKPADVAGKNSYGNPFVTRKSPKNMANSWENHVKIWEDHAVAQLRLPY
jgi:hypothetical protein